MDFSFLGGSMGAVVGEKLARACERCVDRGLPLVVVTASGGARMQEGVLAADADGQDRRRRSS